MSRRQKPRAKHGGGSYIALSRFALQSQSFTRLSPHALKLLLDILSQYNGFNNGDLSMPWTFAAARGWKSRDTLAKALGELLDGGWLIKTRQGGLHRCSLFAVTLFAVDDCRDKNGCSKFDPGISPTNSPPGGWFRDPPQPLASAKRKP